MTAFIIRSVPWDGERYGWARGLVATLNGELVEDTNHNAYDTFLAALQAQGKRDAWHLEDDAMLGVSFEARTHWLVNLHRNAIIQGFSRRGKDLEIGSRWEGPSSFSYNICFYVPGVQAQPLHDFAANWPHREGHPGWYDTVIRDYLKATSQRYWLEVPSLVQHREAMSTIPAHRNQRGCTSPTFIEP